MSPRSPVLRPLPLQSVARASRAFVLVVGSFSAFAAIGCESSGATSLSVFVVDGRGENGVADIDSGDIDFRVRIVGGDTGRASDEIDSGEFDVPLPIPAYEAEMTIEVVVDATSPERSMVGATPIFAPVGHGELRIVVGEVGRCEPITTPDLPRAVASPGVTVFGGALVYFGGLDVTGDPGRTVHAFDPLSLTLIDVFNEPATLSTAVGAAQAVPLSARATDTTTLLLVVGDTGSILFETGQLVSGGTRDRTLAAHVGADETSTVLALGDFGAVIVGGSTQQLTWVSSAGVPLIGELATPRVRPAVVRFESGILVAGGNTVGTPLFEYFEINATAARDSFGDTLEPRDGATLAASPSGDAALLLFGRHPEDGTPEAGAFVDGGFVVTGCPAACTATPFTGDVGTLRAGAEAVVRTSLVDDETTTLVLGGEVEAATPGETVATNLASVIAWSMDTPSVLPHTGLNRPRREHRAIPFAEGVVLVTAGRGVDGVPLDDIELCF